MHTEQEALAKWCPKIRVGLIYRQATENPDFDQVKLATANRGDTMESCLCIASQCMAWRWTELMVHGDEPENRTGYCGAFGKPE